MNWMEKMGGCQKAAAALAPMLRGVWHPKFRGRVRFVQEGHAADGDFWLRPGDHDDLETLQRKLLEDKPEKPPSRVHVAGLGTFEMIGENAPGKALSGKVALVTGGAQGFGEGIARGLAERGAHLVIADLNLEKARAVCQSINATRKKPIAQACWVDVGDEGAVKDLMSECALNYGGLDLLISNAGVLRAGGLQDLSLQDFELVTRVNYTAFFLLTKHGSALMKRQAGVAPAYSADIIQINSKSGLEGSNRNFAYAGSKFGGIGLVQSFAKELVEDRIKVNAICPGNYYEGPLWSDPERGLFVQYLRAGKVPGAKTVEDVYQSYVDKVPMRRGCRPEDVVRAILYCAEQPYETGQAIPVTGGQTMLK